MLLLVFPAIVTLIQLAWATSVKSRPSCITPVNSKQVLVLCSYGYPLPAYAKINPAFEHLTGLRLQQMRLRQLYAAIKACNDRGTEFTNTFGESKI